jgi:ABC-type glycerol-3-phosphate transport system substrate-binding protein
MKQSHLAAGILAFIVAGSSACLAEGQVDALSLAPIPDKANLTVWSFQPGNYDAGADAYARVIAGFEASHPGVTVELVDMPYGTYFDQLRNAIVAQTGPDVVTMYGAAQAFSYRNGLFPLQDVIAPDLRDSLRFVPENFSSDGNLYILPTGTYGYVMIANAELFAKAGVDPVAGMASWPAMLDTCKALAAAGVQPISAGWRDGYYLETYIYMLTSQLFDAASLDKWTRHEIDMTDPVFQIATARILEMQAAGCFGDKAALGRDMYDDTINQYVSGQSAMMVAGTISSAKAAAEAQPGSVVVALPMVPEATNPPLVDSGAETGWGVTRWTEHPEAALAFVTYLAGAEAQGILAEMIDVPANLTGAAPQADTPLEQSYLDLLALPGNHTGFAAFPLPVLAMIEQNAVPLMGGTMTVEDFLAAAQGAFLRSR